MADPIDLLRSTARVSDRAVVGLGSSLLRGAAAPLGRTVYKMGDPDEGQYFQLAFGFIPSGNLGSALGVENPYARFALDMVLDPFNAVNLVPFLGAATKAGRAGAAVRYLNTAERLDNARRLVQFRGLSSEAGRGLEFMSAVARNDVKTVRGMRDLLAEADEPTLAFFRGKGGRELRNAIEAPGYEQLEQGLVKQVQAKQRAAFLARVPFTDLEVPLMRGEWLAKAAQKTPYMSRWLEKVGKAHLDEITGALRKIDAVDSAFHSVEEAAAAGRELSSLDPQLTEVGRLTEELRADLTPLRAEYSQLRSANGLEFVDLQTQLDRHERKLDSIAQDAAKGRLEGVSAYMTEAASVAGSSDVSSAWEPMVKAYRDGLARLRDVVPGEHRRILAAYDGALERALAEPGKARALAGPEVLRGLVQARRAEVGEVVGGLERGALPSAEQAGKSEALRTVRQRGLAALDRGEAAAAGKRPALEARRAELAERIARVDDAIEKGGQRAELFRARRDLPVGTPPRGQARQVPEATSARLNRLARDKQALESELGLIDRQLAGGAEAVTERGAEKLTSQQEKLGLPGEAGLELSQQERLTRGALKGQRAGASFLDRLEAGLPRAGSKDAPDGARLAAVQQEMSDKLAKVGARLPALTAEVRKLAGRTKLGAEPLVARLSAAIQGMADYVGIVQGGEAGKAVRDAIEKAWPRLGAHIKEAHLAAELPTTSRALENDVFSGWNPAMSSDWGGAGRAQANLYGFGPDAKSFADTHVAYEGVTSFRTSAYLARHEDILRRLAQDEAAGLDFMRAFKLTGREEMDFLRKTAAAPTKPRNFAREVAKRGGTVTEQEYLELLAKDEVALFKSMRRMLAGAEAIGHGRWYEQHVAGYFPIIARPVPGKEAEYAAVIRELTEKHRSSVQSRHFRPRISETIDDALAMEKKGLVVVEKNPAVIFKAYMDSLTRVAANQRLYDQLSHGRGFDGLPLLIEKGTEARVSKALGLEGDWGSRYVDVPADKFPALRGAKIHADHQDILQVFGPRNVSEVIREDTPFWRALMRVNLAWKGAVLSMSFFHTVAQAGTIMMYAGPRKAGQFLASAPALQRVAGALGVKGPSVRLQKLLELYGQSGELVEQAIAHGMEWDTFDKLASNEFRGFAGNVADALAGDGNGPGGKIRRVLTSPITGLRHFNDLTHKVTWEYMHNAGKAFLYSEGLQRLLKLQGEGRFAGVPFSTLAKEAAGSANRALGGLNWRKMFGDARVRARMQAFMLAPDWTLANLAQARDFFVGMFGPSLTPDRLGRLPIAVRDITSPAAAGLLARRFWLNASLYGFVSLQALNQAFTGHFTWDNPGGPLNKFKVDLGRKDEKGRPVFLSYGKQFMEPLELLDDPMKFLLGKASPVLSAASTIVMQRDRFGGPITVPTDSTSEKVKKNLGWVARSVLPIGGQSLVRAGRQAADGNTNDALFTMIGAGTGMFDIQIRPAPLLEGQPTFEAVEPTGANDDDLPRSLPRHILPKRQVRFVFPRD